MYALDRVAILLLLTFSSLFAAENVSAQNDFFLFGFFILLLAVIILIRQLFVIKKQNRLEKKQEHQTYEDAIERVQNEAVEAERAKDIFLANVSHETRTPMNAIIGLSHVLLQSDLDTVQKTNISKIKRSAEHLLAITNDILDFSKIEAGKLDINNVNFECRLFFSDLADMMGIQAVEKKLDLIFDISQDIPDTLIGDPLRISQVLINLINNSVKFTDKGEIILHVRVVSHEDDNYQIRFEVEDTGIGLTNEQMSRLFQAFDQADNSISRKYGGTGLGLAISKELVEKMGSKLQVKSSFRGGSTFFFTLPLKTSQDDLKVENRHIERILINKTVLIAESNSYTARILSNILLRYKALPMTVTSLEGMYDQLDKMHYDALFIDTQFIPNIKDKALLYEKSSAIVSLKYDIFSDLSEQYIEIDSSITKPFTYQSVLLSITDIFGKDITVNPVKKTETTYDDILVLKGSKILLAEDNEGNTMVVEGLLEGSGIELVTVTNGQKAVEVVFDRPDDEFELVLMDINMPIMDGYAATSIIREYSKYDDVPIVAMTANITESDIEKSKRYGMQAHLHKPIDVSTFYKTLLQFIRPKTARKKRRVIKEKSPEETALVTLQALPFIDTKDGLSRLNGNVRAYQNILYKFADLFEDVTTEFRALVEDQFFYEGRGLAHNLKGLSGNIGAKEIYALAEELEEAYKDGQGEFDALISTIEQKLAALVQAIRSIKAAESSKQTTEKAPIDSVKIKTLLSKLYLNAKKKKARNIKQACKEIEDHQWPSEHLETVDSILNDAQVYKFDSVQKSILTLIPEIEEEVDKIL